MTDITNIGISEFSQNNSSENSRIDFNNLTIEPASLSDQEDIYSLLEIYAQKGLLLPPTKTDIAERIETFIVAKFAGKLMGCASLRDFGNNLFEIRSLAVSAECAGKSIGTKLVSYLLKNSNIPANSRVFALTYRSNFFNRIGFKCVSKELFPEKIWHDCDICPKKEHCDEQAVMLTTH